MRNSLLIFLRIMVAVTVGVSCVMGPSPLASEPDKQTPRKEFDVDAFMARTVVVDGNANYFSTISGSGIGQPDSTKDKKGQSVKRSTGINIAGITLGSERSLKAQFVALEINRYKGAMLIRSTADLDRAIASNTYGILFYAQTHYPLEGKIDNIQRWYDKGLRILQLQYGSRDGNQGPTEKLGGGTAQKGGLTPLGRKVVLELIRLGIVVDLSHCNAETTIETAMIAKRHNVPVTENHVGVRNVKRRNGNWLARYARNITDEEMLAIKQTGGVVGVMAYGPYLSGPYQKLRMTPPERAIPHATIDDFVAHVDYIAKRIGVEHVGFSTDGYLDGTMAHERTADGILDSPLRWKEAVKRLHAARYSEDDLSKIVGGNFLRVYRQVLK